MAIIAVRVKLSTVYQQHLNGRSNAAIDERRGLNVANSTLTGETCHTKDHNIAAKRRDVGVISGVSEL